MKKTVIERARIPGQSEAGPVHGVHEVDRVASEVGEHEAEHQVPQGRRAAEQHQGEQRETDQERSEEHTSELQSQSNLVCRLLLEKKKKKKNENSRCREMQEEH